jgi:hypothetical protein
VSKRHQANRRKSYGRRQHELSERRDRDPQPADIELGFDDLTDAGIPDHMAFAESRTPRLHYALGD